MWMLDCQSPTELHPPSCYQIQRGECDFEVQWIKPFPFEI